MVDAYRFPRSARLLPIPRPRGRDNRRLLQNLRTIQTKSCSNLGFGRPRNSSKSVLLFLPAKILSVQINLVYLIFLHQNFF